MDPSPSQVIELAVNLDDTTGQVVGDAMRRLLDAGALDAWTVPLGMKKNRPGVMLSALCDPGKRDELARLMIELTGSFGVRFRAWDRLVLARRHETVTTRFGDVRIKVGELDGRVIVARPEFEDCRTLADKSGVPVREVINAAQAEAGRFFRGRGPGGVT